MTNGGSGAHEAALPASGPPAPVLATGGLVLVTAVWGSSFALIHGLVKYVPPTDLNGVRFVIAAAFMAAVSWGPMRRLRRRQVVPALLIGVVYGVAQILQNIGLAYTEASTSGFLTGLCVVITPLLGAAVFRDRVPVVTWGAVALSVLGLAVLSLEGGRIGLGVGEWLTLACALAYSVQILSLGHVVRPEHAIGMAAVMMLGVAMTSMAAAGVDGRVVLPPDASSWAQLLWMALAAGAAAMYLQSWSQARMSASRAALVMALEPVFAALFAVAIGQESPSGRMLLGGSLIVGAMVLVEVVAARSQAGGVPSGTATA